MLKKIFYDYLPFFIGLVLGLVFISHGALAPEMAHFPGDLADARFNNYILEHGYLFATGQTPEFWNAPFMYPERNVITYSDNHLGTLPLYILFRAMNFDRETAFQLWYLLTCALNYLTAYLLLRFLFKNSFAAVIGAMVFAFSIALQSQIPHAQTYSRFIVPVAIWMALLFAKELKVKFFFAMGLCLVYQFYCSFYLGFMLSVPLSLIFVFTLLFRRSLWLLRLRSRNWNMRMLGSVIVCGLVMLPILLPYLERARELGFYPYESIHESLPTLYSFLFSHHGSFFWNILKDTAVEYPAFWDHQIFPGGIAVVCTLLCLLMIIFRKQLRTPNFLVRVDLNTKLLVFSGTLTFLLFLRFGDFSLYRMLFPLPGFGSMRALQRIINIELIFFGIATAFVIDLFLNKRNWIQFAVFLLLVSLVVVDNRIHPDCITKTVKETAVKRVRDLEQKIGLPPLHGILSYEPDTSAGKTIYVQLDAMLAAQDLRMKTLNGYSATSPKWYDQYWVKPSEATRTYWLNGKGLSGENILVIH